MDPGILALGGFYMIVAAVCLLFEAETVNYRPVPIDGIPVGSYPSSTAMLALCVIPTAMIQPNNRLPAKPVRSAVPAFLTALTVFMAAGRFISGVHWLSGIIGGIPPSTGPVIL